MRLEVTMQEQKRETRKSTHRRLGGIMAIILLSALILAGCGASDETSEITAAAEGFLSTLKAGQFDKLSDYGTEELVTSEGLDMTALENLENEMLQTLGMKEEDLSKETAKEIQEFVDRIMTSLIKSYDIGGATESNGKGTVNANIVWGFDPKKAEDVDVSAEVEKIATSYMEEHMDELEELYESDGSEKAMSKITNDLLGDVMEKYAEAILATGEKEQKVAITVTKQEDRWLVTALESAE